MLDLRAGERGSESWAVKTITKITEYKLTVKCMLSETNEMNTKLRDFDPF